MTSEHDQWRELGQQLRVDSIRSSSAAGSGHPTSSMSMAHLLGMNDLASFGDSTRELDLNAAG